MATISRARERAARKSSRDKDTVVTLRNRSTLPLLRQKITRAEAKLAKTQKIRDEAEAAEHVANCAVMFHTGEALEKSLSFAMLNAQSAIDGIQWALGDTMDHYRDAVDRGAKLDMDALASTQCSLKNRLKRTEDELKRLQAEVGRVRTKMLSKQIAISDEEWEMSEELSSAQHKLRACQVVSLEARSNGSKARIELLALWAKMRQRVGK